MTTEKKLQKINADPALWLYNFVKIPDYQGNIVPFKVNEQQKDFLSKYGRFNIILKSRQVGFSTLGLGLILWSACTKPYTNYMVLCHDGDSLQNLFNRLKQMYESIPDKYKIDQRRNNRMELYLQNGSRIAVKVADKNAGRSFSLQGILCDEFAYWNPEEQSQGLASLEQALAKNDSAFLIVLSTANGTGNTFEELFNQAWKGKSKYKAFFYPWYSNKKAFAFEYKEAEDWYRANVNIRNWRIRKEDLTEYEKKLYEQGASLRQIMWRQWKLQDMTKTQFQQEFPATPAEAFVSSNRSVFDTELINQRYMHLPKPLTTLQKPLPQSLVPFLNRGLYIYDDVKENEWYWAGIDVSSGLGNEETDYTACCIFDSSGNQVATFYRNDIPVYKIVDLFYDLGIYFNYASLLIERNTYGLELINRLRKEAGYVNVIRTMRYGVKGKIYDLGFYTDEVSKQMIISELKKAFETGLIQINDRETLDEMKIYVEKGGKLGNIRGRKNHDDLVIATALALQCMKLKKRYV